MSQVPKSKLGVPEVAPAPCSAAAASTAGAFHVGVGFSVVLSVIVAAIMRSLKFGVDVTQSGGMTRRWIGHLDSRQGQVQMDRRLAALC